MNFTKELSLDTIRLELIRMEDSIIFALIERAQFSLNSNIYSTIFDSFLLETEIVHSRFRRYTSPDEYPFSCNLPDPILPLLEYPKILIKNDININNKIKHVYIHDILPLICTQGDDGNYGSSATKDIDALQLLSRRIHFGKFVAEAKFNQNQDEYIKLIKAKDRIGILEMLTNKQVEDNLLNRVKRKAMMYGQDVDILDDGHLKIPLQVVSDLYEKYIIPMTKEIEVEYLMVRIYFIIVLNRQGKCRLSKWYIECEAQEKLKLTAQIHRLVGTRDQKYQSNFAEFRNYKLVYRRYAGLYFCFCVDPSDNELAHLEAIHLFVEILDLHFKNVCELDLVFQFYKCYAILDELCLAGELQETSKANIVARLDFLDRLE